MSYYTYALVSCLIIFVFVLIPMYMTDISSITILVVASLLILVWTAVFKLYEKINK